MPPMNVGICYGNVHMLTHNYALALVYARASKTRQIRENGRAQTQARRKEKRGPQDKQHGMQKGTGKHERETEGGGREHWI